MAGILARVIATELRIRPDDIEGVEVVWDNGDRWDPEIEAPHALPALEVRVRFCGGRVDTVEADVVLTAMLTAMLAAKL